jgi:hypothetical protein
MGLSYEELLSHYDPVVARFRDLFAEVRPLQEKFPKLLKLTMGMSHGVDHWCRVGVYGLAIAHALKKQGRSATPCLEADYALTDAVLYAAFFHDCARRTEGTELTHGRAGEEVWRDYSKTQSVSAAMREAVSQALLFHVDHPSIDPDANEVTICLCNADRLDRVRLGEQPDPQRMYDDGVWQELCPHNRRLYNEIKIPRAKKDLGL